MDSNGKANKKLMYSPLEKRCQHEKKERKKHYTEKSMVPPFLRKKKIIKEENFY